jgi:hypothetical protein
MMKLPLALVKVAMVYTSNSKAMAPAHLMSHFPLDVFHPGMRCQALQKLSIMMPRPMPELASKKARRFVESSSERIGLDTPLDCSRVDHQSRLSAM